MPDPYTGSGWTDPNAGGGGGSPFGTSGLLSVNPTNPSSGGSVNLPSMPTSIPNPGGYGNPQGANEINRNMAITNTQTAAYKNLLAPIFAQLMSQYGTQAGNVFGQTANLGSPFYQQKQAEAFTQQNQQNQNAIAQATQQLRSQGYGYTPSGTSAAMIGGMATAGAQSQAEAYLQQLFNNEQLMLAGAQGEAGLAGMFNPSPLLGGASTGASVNAPSTFFQDLGATTGALQNIFGGGSNSTAAGVGLG